MARCVRYNNTTYRLTSVALWSTATAHMVIPGALTSKARPRSATCSTTPASRAPVLPGHSMEHSPRTAFRPPALCPASPFPATTSLPHITRPIPPTAPPISTPAFPSSPPTTFPRALCLAQFPPPLRFNLFPPNHFSLEKPSSHLSPAFPSPLSATSPVAALPRTLTPRLNPLLPQPLFLEHDCNRLVASTRRALWPT